MYAIRSYYDFSNPTVLYGGKVTGEVNYADNALSLNTTASTVANWRASAPAAPPAAPTNLTATATSHTDVTLAWTDNASDEDGFRLYRSADGVSFSLIATLAANTTTVITSYSIHYTKLYEGPSAVKRGSKCPASASRAPPAWPDLR